MRLGAVAVLREVPFRARRAVAAVVRAVRRAGSAGQDRVPRLPARPDRDRARAVRVRRADPPRGPPAEVRRMARCRGCPRGRHGRGVGRRAVDAERGHLGPALARPARGPWVRPSASARASGGTHDRCARPPAPPTCRRPRTSGAPRRGRASRGDARDVRGRGGTGHGRARRRRAHHGRDGRGVRVDAARVRGRDRGPAHRGSSRVLGTAASAYTRPRARVRVCGCPGERIPGSRCQPRAKRPT